MSAETFALCSFILNGLSIIVIGHLVRVCKNFEVIVKNQDRIIKDLNERIDTLKKHFKQ